MHIKKRQLQELIKRTISEEINEKSKFVSTIAALKLKSNSLNSYIEAVYDSSEFIEDAHKKAIVKKIKEDIKDLSGILEILETTSNEEQ